MALSILSLWLYRYLYLTLFKYLGWNSCRLFTWTWQQRTICGSSLPGTPLTGGTRLSWSITRIPALQIWQVIAFLSSHATCVTLASLCAVCGVCSTGWLVKLDDHLEHRKHCVSDIPGKPYRKHSELWTQSAEIVTPPYTFWGVLPLPMLCIRCGSVVFQFVFCNSKRTYITSFVTSK